MPIARGKQRGGSDFGIAPLGMHQAVCVDVIDEGEEVHPEYGERHRICIVWQVVPYDDEGQEIRNSAGERFRVREWYNLTITDGSNLGKLLTSWRGKPFTPEEIDGFEVDNVIGANCQIQIVHGTTKAGREIAKPQSVVPLMKGMQRLSPEGYERNPNHGGSDDESTPF